MMPFRLISFIHHVSRLRRTRMVVGVTLALFVVGAGTYYLTRETRAAPGDYAIYREAAGLESLTTTASDQAWDTTVSAASLFSIDAGRTTVTLSEAGHYLALYTLGTEIISGGTQAETQGHLSLGGVQSTYGRASCHITNSGGQSRCFMAGSAIIEAPAVNSTLKVVAQRTDDNSAGVRRRANSSGLMLLRLDDDWAYGRYREVGGGQSFNTTAWTTVSIDTSDESDTGYSRTDGAITLTDPGHYLITTNVHFQSGTTNRNRLLGTRLTLNGFELPGTVATGLMRGSNSTQDAVASFVGIVEATTSNQVLRLEAASLGEQAGQTTNAANGTAISIVKLPETVEFVRLTETGGGQQVFATNDPILWDTNLEDDIVAFSHSTTSNTSRVTVNESDDYLFFSNFYSDRAVTNSTVIMDPHWEWRLNGTTKQTYGSFSHVNLGDQSNYGAHRAGASGGTIFPALTTGDYIEVVNTNESTGTVVDPSFQALRMGIQGLRISTLEEPDITAVAVGSQKATSTIPANDFYIGGSFLLRANHSNTTETIESVTITEKGTVDAQNDLNNIRLYYEYDTSTPFDCASESYGGTEIQYGATSTAFSSANGSSTFSGSVTASTTQAVCMYVVVDVQSTASDGETIEVELAAPSIDVVLTDGTVGPNLAVVLSGSTLLEDDYLTQTHYHWRLDTALEATSPSATGDEDVPLIDLPKNAPRRLRFGVSNEGSVSSASTQFRIEYATRTGSCLATASGWTDVGAVGGAWDMFDSVNLTDGDNTTNIATTTGGVIDENLDFLVVNGGVRDTTSETGALVLTETEFVELEYSLVATVNAQDGESYCFRVTDAGTPLAAYDAVAEVSVAADVLVSALGAHRATVDASTTDVYLGGSFAIKDQSGSRNVTSVTIAETGSVDAQNDLTNVRLLYELDTNTPFDCAAETYDGTEDQYGATSTSFSTADGSATFSETVGIDTSSAMCLYVVVDVLASAENNETITVEIADPGTDVVVSAGSVNPNSPVAPTGSTVILASVLTQTHFHWRSDTGTETGAPSKTGGIEDTGITNVKKAETERLRMGVSNEGSTTSAATAFTLEYAERSGSCDASSGWEAVDTPGGKWVMSDSSFLTNGANTTNIATSTGGVTDENSVFLTPNGAVLDTQPTSSPLVLTASNWVEFEFALEATANADFGTTYCFRLTGDGADVKAYDNYPQATVRQNQDFFVQRGTNEIPNNETTVQITAGVDYIAPSATSGAFIRVTGTLMTGAGRTTSGGTLNAADVTVYVLNPENIQNSITFARDGTTNNTRFSWEILEYTGPAGGDNEMVVRHVRTHTFGNKSAVENIAVPGVVDDTDVVVFVTGQGNPQANATDYYTGIVTTEWNGAADEVILERGGYSAGAGNAAYTSFAVVEFTGSNWVIQRAEHTYSAAGSVQTQTITDVNDLSRAFVHAQHRTTQNTVANLGHLVWLSAVGTVSFQLNGSATTPAGHTSVAWVIENTQTNGAPLTVTRTNGAIVAGGPEPAIYSIAAGTTIGDLDTASVFTTAFSNGIDTQHPRAILDAVIASTTHYELFVGDTGETRTYRSEIVEWPTAVLAITQNYYRFYVDNDALDPVDPWPLGATDLGENTAITGADEPPGNGSVLRLRMSLRVTGANLSQQAKIFALEYGVRETACSAVSDWLLVGDAASTTASWRGYNATPLDGTALSGNPPTANDLNLSVSDRSGTYEEASPSAANPYKIFIGEDVEYDWILEAHDASDLTSYCFRMVEDGGGPLDDYLYYPTITLGGFQIESQHWRFFSDVTSLTPTVPMAASNTAPVDVGFNDAVKLRVMLEESAGRAGVNTKFKLQYSTYPDFSVAADVDDMDVCSNASEWCYYDGAGAEGATITAKVLDAADSCSAGMGDGCGTHNEYSYAPDIVGEVGTTSVNSAGTVVTLQHTYADPVFIVEALTGDATGGAANDPVVAIITATSSSGFTVRAQEPDNEADDHGSEVVGYLVMERGSYQLPDGRRVDVDTKDVASYYGNAVAGASDDTCTFTQSFSAPPILLTALQSNNNTGAPDFLTASQANVTASNFFCSMEVPDGEISAPAVYETYGWVAVEQGAWHNNGIALEATTTGSAVTGWTNTPWYEKSFTALFNEPPGIVASKQTRAGAEGGWVRYDAMDVDSVQLAIDERDDGERSHTSENVGYLAFATSSGVLYRTGTGGFTYPANAKAEFEFTLLEKGVRVNTTYFFRLYDTERDQPVTASSTIGYPSVTTEGAQLSFVLHGIEAGSATEGVVTDVTTSATLVPFGSLPLGVDRSAAQRLTVSTNANEGYQVLVYERQDLTAGLGATISDIAATNNSPSPWSTACSTNAASCYGYHVGDNTLSGNATRFLVDDTYAALNQTPAEVAYSTVPVENEQTDIVYRIRANAGQPAGLYESSIVYIVVPVF